MQIIAWLGFTIDLSIIDRVISVFVYACVGDEPEIVEIGSSISKAPQFEGRMALGFGNGVKVDFMVRSTEDGRSSREREMRIDAAAAMESRTPSSVITCRHFIDSR